MIDIGNIEAAGVWVGATKATSVFIGNTEVWEAATPPSPLTKVKYTAASGLPDWEGDIFYTLTSSSIPNRTSIEEVQIGSDVVEIGNAAFVGCTNLTSVTIPDSVAYIDSSAFKNCTGLTSVTIPSSVVDIRDDAFYNCSSIANVYCDPGPSDLEWMESECDDFKADGSTVCHVKAEYLTAYQTKFTGEVNVTFAGDLT